MSGITLGQKLSWKSELDFYPKGVVDCGGGNVLAYSKTGSNASSIVKLDNSGKQLWRIILPVDIQQMISVNNDYYFCGSIAGTPQLDGINYSSRGVRDGIIIKLKPNGAITWVRQFGGQNDDIASHLCYYPFRNSLMVTGYVESDFYWQDQNVANNLEKSAIINEVSLDGALIQHHEYNFVPGKNDLNSGIEISCAGSGVINLLVHREGYSWTEENPTGLQQGTYYMRLDKDFNISGYRFIISNACYYGYSCSQMAASEDEVLIPTFCSLKYGGEGSVMKINGNNCTTTWSLNCKNSTYAARSSQGRFFIAGTEGRIVCPCPGNLPGCEVLRELDGSDSGRVLLRAVNCNFGSYVVSESGDIYISVNSRGTNLAGDYIPEGIYLCAISEMVTGLSTHNSAEQVIEVFPNPVESAEKIKILLPSSETNYLSIYNLQGVPVASYRLDQSQNLEIDVSAFSDGTYILVSPGLKPRKIMIQ